jgi:predicted RNA binding protein with dsRBD fold (UPF0201 family)
METTNTLKNDRAARKAQKALVDAMVLKVERVLNSPNPTKRREAVEKAILVLFERQTSDEQDSESTNHNNAVGFSSADARRLSFVAKILKEGKHLKDETVAKYAPRVLKYRKQLAVIALEKQAAQQKAQSEE